jgi:hypothetical protein
MTAFQLGPVGSSALSSVSSSRSTLCIRILNILILAICLPVKNANAFFIPTGSAPNLQIMVSTSCEMVRTCPCIGGRKSNNMQLGMEIISFESDDETLVEPATAKAAVMNPSNMPAAESSLFVVGSLISVSKKGLKAFNVPPAACGSFDKSTKVFLPWSKDDATAGTKYLTIPVGLQGEVVRVIDPMISANHPIQVKFEAGEQPDGFDLPAGFSFHFGTNELKLIK